MGGADPALKGNKPPTLTLEGPATRTVKVGDTVALTAVALDDRIPRARAMPALNPGVASRFTVESATGLRLSWFVHRGKGQVVFDPVQAKVWEDTRDNANSPWSYGWRTPAVPADGKWVVRATFREPGTYVLRCQAHDGGLATTADMTVVVTN
jgi:plastocyanin